VCVLQPYVNVCVVQPYVNVCVVQPCVVVCLIFYIVFYCFIRCIYIQFYDAWVADAGAIDTSKLGLIFFVVTEGRSGETLRLIVNAPERLFQLPAEVRLLAAQGFKVCDCVVRCACVPARVVVVVGVGGGDGGVVVVTWWE